MKIPKATSSLNQENIVASLPNALKQVPIHLFETLPSTNDTLKALALEGAPEYTVVMSNQQIMGKGQKGHQFYSPNHSGLYFSILLKPKANSKQHLYLTAATAVAAAEAIEQVTAKNMAIKWVNDLFYQEKKVGGILCEAVYNPNSDSSFFVIVGIGINLTTPKNNFPLELQNKAIALYPEGTCPAQLKNELAAALIQNIHRHYHAIAAKELLNAYKKRCFFLGHNIYILKDNKSFSATALDITSDFHLKVRYHDNETDILFANEISINPFL